MLTGQNSFGLTFISGSDRPLLSALSFLLVLPVVLEGLRIHAPHALCPLPVDHAVLLLTEDTTARP